MGITIHYRALPRDLEDGETIEDLRRTLENVAMDSAIHWAAFLGLPEPQLIKSKKGARIQLHDQSEDFELWQAEKRPYDDEHYLWRGFTKTQYAPPTVHIQVAMICKDLVRSGIFERGFTSVTDEADFFGDWFDIAGMIGSILENMAIIENIAGTLRSIGWKDATAKDTETEPQDIRMEESVKAIIRAGLDELDLLVYEKAKSITEREEFQIAAKITSDRIAEKRGFDCGMVEPLLKRLQKDLVLLFYEYSEEELKMLNEESIIKWAMAKFDIRAIDWKVAPIFSEME